MRVLVALYEGVSRRKVERIFCVDDGTVRSWLMAASAHAEAVLEFAVRELELEQVQVQMQMDGRLYPTELYTLLREVGKRSGSMSSTS